MTIVQLEYLIAVANHGSFSLASEYCYVTQPSLSTQIKNLEDELGVVLLNRNEKPITVTDAGKVVIEQAQEAIASFHTIADRVKELKGEIKGTFRLGVIPTIAPYLLHRFIPDFVKKYPELNIQIKEMYTRDIESALRKGTLDMGVLAYGFTNPSEIVEEVLYIDKLFVYHAPNSPLAKLEDVHIADIDVNSLILLPDGHCLRTQVIDLCNAKNRKHINFNFESASLDTITRMVDIMGGATILPQMAVELLTDARKKQVKPFSAIINAKREISLAVSKNFYRRSTYKAIKEAILKYK